MPQGYPFANDTIDAPDSFGYGKRECVSYTAWCARLLGANPFFWGNADQWMGNAKKHGIAIDGVPNVKDIVVLPPGVDGAGSFGHVAYIEEVGTTLLTVSDYNWGDTHQYNVHTLPRSLALGYIRFVPLEVKESMRVRGPYFWVAKNQQHWWHLAADGVLTHIWWPGPSTSPYGTQVIGGTFNPNAGVDWEYLTAAELGAPFGQLHLTLEDSMGKAHNIWQGDNEGIWHDSVMETQKP